MKALKSPQESAPPGRPGLPAWGRWVIAVFTVLALAESLGITLAIR